MKSCINGENCAGLPCVYIKLLNFEIQKCDHINFYVHIRKPYFLMLGHNYALPATSLPTPLAYPPFYM